MKVAGEFSEPISSDARCEKDPHSSDDQSDDNQPFSKILHRSDDRIPAWTGQFDT